MSSPPSHSTPQLLSFVRLNSDGTPYRVPAPDGFCAPEGVNVAVPDESMPGLVFDVSRFSARLMTRRLGRELVVAHRIPSTQDVLSENKAILSEGALCVADTQTSGRGRGKNPWLSPEGCLVFSLLLFESNGRQLPLIQYVVALAVSRAAEELCAKRKVDGLKVGIKWPNDVFVNGLKIGGILCNSSHTHNFFRVVVGVGLNIDNEKPTTCLNAQLRGVDPAAAPVSKEEMLAEFLNSLEPLLDVFKNQGFGPLKSDYLARWLHWDQEVLLSEPLGDGSMRHTSVRIKDLTEGGFLLAVDENGTRFELSPDGNSLDFFQGLLCRKLP